MSWQKSWKHILRVRVYTKVRDAKICVHTEKDQGSTLHLSLLATVLAFRKRWLIRRNPLEQHQQLCVKIIFLYPCQTIYHMGSFATVHVSILGNMLIRFLTMSLMRKLTQRLVFYYFVYRMSKFISHPINYHCFCVSFCCCVWQIFQTHAYFTRILLVAVANFVPGLSNLNIGTCIAR